MERIRYIGGDVLSLVEYLCEDDAASYANWQDPETQIGFNYVLRETFEQYAAKEKTQRFLASILLNGTGEVIGMIGLSPQGSPPDLAIWIYKPYRNRGYGTEAFALGARYSFETLKLDMIYAGCYPYNIASQRMLAKCGFVPNPSGNLEERHVLTGEPITQCDYILE